MKNINNIISDKDYRNKEKLLYMLQESEFFDITNIFNYFMSNVNKKYFNRSNDFPRVVPPFRYMWMEAKLDKNIGFGTFIDNYVIDEENENPNQIRNSIFDDLISNSVNLDRNDYPISNIDHAKWVIAYHIFGFHAEGFRFLSDLVVFLDKGGQEIDGSMIISYPSERDQGLVLSALLCFYYSLSFMNCKNVEIIKKDVSDKVRKKRKNKGYPDIEFKQLKVNPVSKRYISDQDRESLDKNRFHICRGHFKDYSKGNGLFGRYKGIYWWDQCFKGSEEKGIIEKEYIV